MRGRICPKVWVFPVPERVCPKVLSASSKRLASRAGTRKSRHASKNLPACKRESLRKGRLSMAKLIYGAITSLDGYVADADGNFDWAEPDEEVFTCVNDLERQIGTYLYGRRMYEVMVSWETVPTTADQSPVERDFAELWQAADKIVYSTTLESVSSARTRIERAFDPEVIRQWKATAAHDRSEER